MSRDYEGYYLAIVDEGKIILSDEGVEDEDFTFQDEITIEIIKVSEPKS